ncbi:MAG: TonB-dependent receptor [candidate division KSB1 bacterium]|nr:TonB-dependent receptor [candidate division KSB1 bacterium]
MMRVHAFVVGLLAALLIFVNTAQAQNRGTIQGKVIGAESGEPLPGANILIEGTTLGAATNANGEFVLKNIPFGQYMLRVTYIGYATKTVPVTLTETTVSVTVELSQDIITGPVVTVVATRAKERVTPVTFSTLDEPTLRNRYTVEDIPQLLSELPSTTFYSENGNGLGYNYLSIRGFDQRRISVMINGIPQNDPEDHNVYWIDFPDMVANVQSIQVQRGAGMAFYGPAAIGGSVNIQTSYFSPERVIKAFYGAGDFNTRKASLSLNSGLINDKYVLFGRVSNIKSDGYRERAWVNFWSYFFGAAMYDKKHTLRLHIYGGPIEDGLAYYGLPKFANEDENLRRKNFSYWGLNDRGDSLTYYAERRSDEIENFNQPHYELLHEYRLNDRVTINNNLFYIRGYGFFDYDGSWGTPEYYRLTPEYGYNVQTIPSDALIRAYVDNKQGGWLPQLMYRHARGELVVGAELRVHRSLHWGRLQKGSGLPADVVGDNARRYYEYKGAKDIASFYIHDTYAIWPNVIVMADVQFAYKRYRLYDEKFIGTEFTVPYKFVNPRFGVNVNLTEALNLYVNLSRTSREPRLKNLYDAAEASTPDDWGPVVPQFETRPDGSYDFSKPLVKPEQLTDLELGFGWRTAAFHGTVNLFYMDFRDEIIKKGGLDRFGQPRTGNAERTLHQGIEVSAGLKLLPQLDLSGNFMVSKNELKKYTIYKSDGTPVRLDGNPIAGFPDRLANLRLTYSWHNVFVSLGMQYVGKQYTDNFKNERNTVDPYTVFNLNFRYKFTTPWLRGLVLQGRINNLFNNKYLMYGIDEQFFPAAPRNAFLSLQFEM